MSDADVARPPTEVSPSPARQTDTIHLRITYLHAGNPRPPHDLGAIPASTTISDLRLRLRDVLPEHPEPIEQRLIYQGRPLMNSNATLREALRLDGPIGPLPYTLHIILQTRGSQNIPRTQTQSAPPNPIPQPTPNMNMPNMHMQNMNIPQNQAGVNFNNLSNQDILEQTRQMQEMAQASLNMIQQQLGIFNPGGHNNGQPQPATSTNVMINDQPVNLNAINQTGFAIQHNPVDFHHAHAEQHRLTAEAAHREALQTHHFPLPNQPPHISQSQHVSIHHGPTGTTVSRDFTGPNGERVTSTVIDASRLSNTPPNLINPFGRPASAPLLPPPPSLTPNPLPQRLEPTPMVRNGTPPIRPNPAAPVNRHLPYPFSTPQFHTSNMFQPQQRTSLWLTVSPSGPEAVLFAPGHGVFTSPRPQSITLNPSVAQPPGQGEHLRAAIAPDTGPRPQIIQNAAANVAPALAVRQAPAAAQMAARQQNRHQAENDPFAIIIQRAWLFLRLYMFTFVLSEPGTWRRWFLLAVAIMICILPRQNPFTQLFTLARRHLENLIGPPHLGQRDQRRPLAVQQPATPGVQVPATQNSQTPHPRGAVTTSPEETAARLVREHQQHNPSFVRDTIYRLEQSVALFLASLIPGVGERYVRAREATREAERRREEEARNVSNTEQIQAQAQETNPSSQQQSLSSPSAVSTSENQDGTTTAGEKQIPRTESETQVASSSGVEPRNDTEAGEIRARHTSTGAWTENSNST